MENLKSIKKILFDMDNNLTEAECAIEKGKAFNELWEKEVKKVPEAIKEASGGQEPVSYTHLDVYKRQRQQATGLYAVIVKGVLPCVKPEDEQ